MKKRIMGRGTWIDKIANQLIERERKLGRLDAQIKVESGLGASGFPHLGSFADAARAYGIKLALQDQGYPSEYIAFSDDMDGLRRVPDGLPKWLNKYIAHPVSMIPDPFKCHESFGVHMSSLLLETLDQVGVSYKYISAMHSYKRGDFNDEIRLILENATKVGSIIQDELSQEKYVESLPFFAVCQNCGRIYTTRSTEWSPKEGRILYECIGSEIRGKWIEGCGHEGEVDLERGEGKLSWKVEFAARWNALDIRFEAFGKDIADSVRVNDRIMTEIFKKPPPYHVRYEMFLDKKGRKISKSTGNVFTPQIWLRYGSPQALLLLMYKRIIGTRELSVLDIPKYMDEIDSLEDVYFGKKRIENEKEKIKLKGLYEYSHLLKPPPKPSIHVPYNLLLTLARLAPKNDEKNFLFEKLRAYNYPVEDYQNEIEKRITYALNWIKDFEKEIKLENTDIYLTPNEKKAIETFAESLIDIEKESEIQDLVFSTARRHHLSSKKFFKILYKILTGRSYGPKLAPYIISLGKEETVKLLKGFLESSSFHENIFNYRS